jgi:nitrile hydratase accessory protein
VNELGRRRPSLGPDPEGNTSAIPAEDPVVPQRKNGELVFESPWESRAFGMAVALHDAGAFSWDRFSRRLGERLTPAGPSVGYTAVLPAAPDTSSMYYKAWIAALEDVLTELGHDLV